MVPLAVLLSRLLTLLQSSITGSLAVVEVVEVVAVLLGMRLLEVLAVSAAAVLVVLQVRKAQAVLAPVRTACTIQQARVADFRVPMPVLAATVASLVVMVHLVAVPQEQAAV